MNRRTLHQIHTLKQNGIDIPAEEFFQKAGPGPLYRVKMLDVLADQNRLSSKRVMRMTNRFFGPETRYEPKDTFAYRDFKAICDLIRGAGGKVVLAHPGRIRKKNQELYNRLIVDEKLDGLEVFHYHNNPEVRSHLLSIAHERGLMVTGGTDYHGRYQKDPVLPGDEILNDEVFQAMKPLLKLGK